MNNEQRQVFWDTLISLDGKNLEADCKRLQETIMFPKYLYRYRPASLKSIEALRTNRLYFSTANYYDDPFDTFINIDLQDMKRVFDELSQNYEEEKIFEAGKAFLTNIAPGAFSDEMIEKMVHVLGDVLSNSSFRFEALQFVRNIRNEVKKDIWSVCFSENGFNEALWLKYAQQHKGFAVQYDLERPELLLCGTEEKCKECGVLKWGTPLYPVYYSDQQYNGTKYGQFISYCLLLSKLQSAVPMQSNNMITNLIAAYGNMNWEKERITLIKKQCHQYDEEWRIILNCAMKGPVMREWIPSGVILGLNMDEAERNLTIAAAKEAGVTNIYQSFIDDKGLLNAFTL